MKSKSEMKRIAVMKGESMQTYKMGGLKLRFGQYTFRIWSKGFEFGNRLGGRVFFFPWSGVKK